MFSYPQRTLLTTAVVFSLSMVAEAKTPSWIVTIKTEPVTVVRADAVELAMEELKSGQRAELFQNDNLFIKPGGSLEIFDGKQSVSRAVNESGEIKTMTAPAPAPQGTEISALLLALANRETSGESAGMVTRSGNDNVYIVAPPKDPKYYPGQRELIVYIGPSSAGKEYVYTLNPYDDGTAGKQIKWKKTLDEGYNALPVNLEAEKYNISIKPQGSSNSLLGSSPGLFNGNDPIHQVVVTRDDDAAERLMTAAKKLAVELADEESEGESIKDAYWYLSLSHGFLPTDTALENAIETETTY